MEDLKIYGSNNKQTTSLVNTSSLFLQNIGLELGPAKCASATLIKGKEIPSSTLILMDNTTMRGLQPDETYKYLGVAQSTHIHKEEMRANISNEYHRRVRKVYKRDNGLNKGKSAPVGHKNKENIDNESHAPSKSRCRQNLPSL